VCVHVCVCVCVPSKDVQAPDGTIGILSRAQSRTISCTSAVLFGKTTACKGVIIESESGAHAHTHIYAHLRTYSHDTRAPTRMHSNLWGE